MRFVLRWLRNILLIMGLLMVLLAVGGYVWLQTEGAKQFLAQMLSHQVETEDMQLEIKGLSGTLPFMPHADTLTFSDKKGVWLRLEKVRLHVGIDFLPLTWRIRLLSIEKTQLSRIPEGNSDAKLPPLPRIVFEKLSLPSIVIDKAVTGRDTLYASLEGSGPLDAWQGKVDCSVGNTPLFTADIATKEGTLQVKSTLYVPDTAAYQALRQVSGKEVTLTAALRMVEGGKLTLDEARVVSQYADLSLAGEVEQTAQGFKVKAHGNVLKSSPLPLLGEKLAFTLEGENNDRTYRFSRITLDGQHARLEGSGQITPDRTLAATLHAVIPDASMLYPSLKGALEGQAELKGKVESVTGTLSLALKAEEEQWHVETPLRFEKDQLTLSAIKGKGKDISIAGQARYHVQTKHAEGELHVTTARAGKGSVHARLLAHEGKQQLFVEGEAEGMRFGGATAKTAKATLHMTDLAHLAGLNASLTATSVQGGAYVAETLSLKAEGRVSDMQLKLDIPSKRPQAFAMHATGAFVHTPSEWNFTLKQLQATLQRKQVRLTNPVVLKGKGSTLSFTPLLLQVGEGSMRAEGTYAKEAITIKAALTRLPLTLFTKEHYDGAVSGTLALQGTATRPSVLFTLTTEGLIREVRGGKGFTLASTGRLEPDKLILKAQVKEIEGTLVTDMRLPARFSLSPLQCVLFQDKPLEGRMIAHVDTKPLSRFFLPEGQRLTGRLDGELRLQGTLSRMRALGDMRLKDASYRNAATGTNLTDMQLTLSTRRDALFISEGTARAGSGNVAFSGTVGLSSPYHLALEAKANDAALVNNKDAIGNATGSVHVSGPVTAPLIAGALTLGPMEIRLPEAPDATIPQVKLLNETVLPQQEWERGRIKRLNSDTPSRIRLDLRLHAPNRTFVRGRGLDTEIRGDLAVKGMLHAPEIEGELRAVHGTYTLLDRQLTIQEGVVTFRGAMPPSPFIRMVAETTTKELTAGVRIEGSLRNPDLTLTSTPARPEDEVMANLLFGRELRTITPFQAMQLAQAVQSLHGGKSTRLDLLGKARNFLKVDRLNVGETEKGTMGVGAGKYINDKVYIGVEGGAAKEAGKIKAEIEVTPRFTVEPETGGASSGVRVNWKHDY